MPEKPFLGAFTDIPGKEGFEFAPARPGWKEYSEEPPAMRMPQKPKLEGFVTPDYSAEGRQRFEKLVFTKIGGNPAKIDVMKAVSEANKALPKMFADYFMGRVIWEDRGRLSKEQADEWEDVTKRWRAHVYNMVTSKKNTMIDEHKWMMSTFDSKATEYKAALTRERKEHKERLEEWKEARKPPKPVKPELKPNQALKQINTIIKARADIGKGNIVTDALFAMIAKEDPEAAKDILPFLNKELGDTERADLEEIWRKRIEYLMPLIPEGSRPKISFMIKEPIAKGKEIKGRAIVERRTYKGRTLIKYSDGSIEEEK